MCVLRSHTTINTMGNMPELGPPPPIMLPSLRGLLPSLRSPEERLLTDMERQLLHSANDKAIKIASLDDQIKYLKSCILTKEEEISSLTKERDSLNVEVKALRERCKVLEKDVYVSSTMGTCLAAFFGVSAVAVFSALAYYGIPMMAKNVEDACTFVDTLQGRIRQTHEAIQTSGYVIIDTRLLG